MKVILIPLLTLTFLITRSQTENKTTRKGLIGGISAGTSHSLIFFSNKNQNTIDLGLNWKIGYMLKPDLAVLLNGCISIYKYDLTGRNRKRDFGGIFPSIQYFSSDKFWLLAGIGIGADAPVFYDVKPETKEETNYYSGFGFISSAGYEVYRKKNYAIDLQLRLNYSSVSLPIGKTNGFTTALLLGITFY